MTQITSIDALIDRLKEAYPAWSEDVLVMICREMGNENFVFVYERISNPGSGYKSFSPDCLLEILDEDGKYDEMKLSSLIAQARELKERMAREPLRRKLDEDFLESYDFEPAYWD